LKIPLYTSRATATNQAPGSSITARKNPQPFVNAALAKAEVANTALSAVGQYAKHRFEVTRDNLLNEANLGIQEELYTRSRELADSDDIDNVLDGDNPIWSQEVQRITDKYKKIIRNDEYSQNTFNLKSKQTEMQHRFWLRNQVDQKIDVKSVNNYVLGVKQLEDRLGTYDITEQDFILERNRIVREGEDLLKKGLVKPGSIEDTIYNLTKTLARKSITDFITRNPNRELQTLDTIRKLIRDNPGMKRAPDMIGNPEEAALMNELRYPLTLLRDLDPVDQAQVLGNTDTIINEIYGPTAMEKAEAIQQKAIKKEKEAELTALRKTIKSQTTDITTIISDRLANGYDLDDDTLQTITDANDLVNSLEVTPENEEVIKNFRREYKNLQIAQSLNKNLARATPSEIAQELRELYALGPEAQKNENTQFAIDYLEKFQKKNNDGISTDPLNHFAKTEKTDIGQLDLTHASLQDGLGNQNAISMRKKAALRAEDRYQLPEVVYLTNQEVSLLKDQFYDGNVNLKMDILGGLERQWGTAAKDIFKQLGFNDAQFTQIAGLYGAGGTSDTLKRILVGMDKEKNNTSAVDPTAITPLIIAEEFADEFSDVFPDGFYSQEDIAAIQQNARYYLLSGTNLQPRPRDIEDAIIAVTGLNKNTNTGGLQKYNKKYFLAPSDVSGEQVSEALELFPPAALEDQGIDVSAFDPDLFEEIRNEQFDILKFAPGQYIFVDEGVVLADAEGNVLKVDLSALVKFVERTQN
tara:strand:- start:6479 stop:8737 length:2259 start_codon:yes stop_codon:yes gene_type:complete